MQIEQPEVLAGYRLAQLIEQDIDGFKTYCHHFQGKSVTQAILITLDGIEYSVTPQGINAGTRAIWTFSGQIQTAVADILSCH